MTSQQLESTTQDLEQRVKKLETALLHIQEKLSQPNSSADLWWLKIAGSFEQDPTFDEAIRLGQEWRKSIQEA